MGERMGIIFFPPFHFSFFFLGGGGNRGAYASCIHSNKGNLLSLYYISPLFCCCSVIFLPFCCMYLFSYFPFPFLPGDIQRTDLSILLFFLLRLLRGSYSSYWKREREREKLEMLPPPTSYSSSPRKKRTKFNRLHYFFLFFVSIRQRCCLFSFYFFSWSQESTFWVIFVLFRNQIKRERELSVLFLDVILGDGDRWSFCCWVTVSWPYAHSLALSLPLETKPETQSVCFSTPKNNTEERKKRLFSPPPSSHHFITAAWETPEEERLLLFFFSCNLGSRVAVVWVRRWLERMK